MMFCMMALLALALTTAAPASAGRERTYLLSVDDIPLRAREVGAEALPGAAPEAVEAL